MDFAAATRRLRQHHGIEHATVTVLSQHLPGIHIVARSDFSGFVVYGNVDTSALRVAAEDALARLQRGERRLAVQPHCGTNFATAGVLTGVAALLAGSGARRSFWWERLPSAILAATLALFIAAPLGRWLQENVTTSGEVDGLCIASVEPVTGLPFVTHRVLIARSSDLQ